MEKYWNWNQFKAAGKHAASYAAGCVTVFVAFHVLTPMQGNDVAENINYIGDGIANIAKGVAGLIAVLTPIYTAWRAANNASPVNQAASLEKTVPGTVIVTSPEIARAIPSPNVKSNTEAKVVTQ